MKRLILFIVGTGLVSAGLGWVWLSRGPVGSRSENGQAEVSTQDRTATLSVEHPTSNTAEQPSEGGSNAIEGAPSSTSSTISLDPPEWTVVQALLARPAAVNERVRRSEVPRLSAESEARLITLYYQVPGLRPPANIVQILA